MIVTIDCNTKPVELYHLSILFQSLAKAHGFVAPVQEFTVGVDVTQHQAEAAVKVFDDVQPTNLTNLTTVTNAAGETLGNVDLSKPDSVEKSDAGVSYGYTIVPPVVAVDIDPVTPPTTNTNLDVSGLPWDARIHAGSRERNTDGSWRVRRRPKGVEEADWDATLARVTAELTDLMAIPVSPGAVADAAAEEALTDAEVDAFVDIMDGLTAGPTGSHVEQLSDGSVVVTAPDAEPVVVAPPVTIAPPVVVPPVTAVAPPIDALTHTHSGVSPAPTIETFAQLMSWLTSRTPKDEAAKPAMVTRVNEILAANGLTTLQQLGQRADLIPQVLVQFQAAFGE